MSKITDSRLRKLEDAAAGNSEPLTVIIQYDNGDGTTTEAGRVVIDNPTPAQLRAAKRQPSIQMSWGDD